MKKNICLLIILWLSIYVQAQSNLVPNPGFETYVQCPSTNNNIADCSGWMNFGNTPEYFNACGPNGVSVPYAGYGFQFTHTGNGMTGLVTWLNSLNDPQNANYREYIATQLTTTLSIGQKYFISLYVNYSGYPNNGIQTQIASNKIGLKFSTVLSNSMTSMPVNNVAHLYTNLTYSDTLNWLKLSGSFVADSAYKYVVIGNFFDDLNTDTLSLSNEQLVGYASYYFIDDICVGTDSLYANSWTGINDNINKSINLLIFPNPASDFIIVESRNVIYTINIYDVFGKLVVQEKVDNKREAYIDIKKLVKGIYYIRVNDQDASSKKIIIH